MSNSVAAVAAEIPREASPVPMVENALNEPEKDGRLPSASPPSTSSPTTTNENKEHESEDGIDDALSRKSEVVKAPNKTDEGAGVPTLTELTKDTSDETVSSEQAHQVPSKETNGDATKEQNGAIPGKAPNPDTTIVQVPPQPTASEVNGGLVLPQGVITSEQEVQSPTTETNNTDSTTQGETPLATATELKNGVINGDSVGSEHIRIQEDEDAALPKSNREEDTEGKRTKAVRRSSTLGYIAEKTRPFIPRGRVHKRTTARHGGRGSSGGCVIF